MNNKLRIIAGKYRGRKLSFGDFQGLRPTPDRVRETLFNWLNNSIYQSNCLDLYSGSGALGFEALSRGAAQVTLLDNNRQVCLQLNQNLKLLSCTQAQVVCMDAIDFLFQQKLLHEQEQEQEQEHEKSIKKYNIVFLDPPFNQGLLEKCCAALEKLQLLDNNCLIYIESEKQLLLDFIPPNWHKIKHKQAGQLAYSLFHR